MKSPQSHAAAGELLSLMAQECIACDICLKSCDFLAHYGNPGTIAEEQLAGVNHELTSFCCHLCNLCRQVCPKDLPIVEMFLSMRRVVAESGRGSFPEHRRLRWYEKIGNSWLFKAEYLPSGCSTIFFPGCAIPGLHPEETMKLYEMLHSVEPNLGLVFGCCGKPSHDLGREKNFQRIFGRYVEKFRVHGIRRILTVCPSCLQIFRQYGGGMEVESAYSLLPFELVGKDYSGQTVAVHDSCTLRFDRNISETVRKLVDMTGVKRLEMAHSQETTFCCGEGGGAGNFRRGVVTDWRTKRLSEADGLQLITLCAGCTYTLGREKTTHILQFLFSERPVTSGWREHLPWQHYINRLRLVLGMKLSWRKTAAR